MSNEILELFEAWLKEHDAKVRKQTLLDSAELFDCGFSHQYSDYAEYLLRRIANTIEVAK